MLQEARIDKLDAMKAAVEYPLSFKQTLVKVLKSKGFKIDREKTFKKPSIGSGDGLLLYGKSGNASTNARDGSRKEIYIYLHDGNRIRIEPDTMGNVIINDSNNNRKKIKIAGVKSIDFFNNVADTVSILEPIFGPEFKDFIDNMSKDLGYSFSINRNFRGDSKYTITTELRTEIPDEVKSEIQNKTKIEEILGGIFDDPIIKSAYKKTTGNSAGKKDSISTISKSFYDVRKNALETARAYYAIDNIKDLVLAVREYLKDSQYVITSVLDDITYIGIKISITMVDGANIYKERSKISAFNVFRYIKRLKRNYDYKSFLSNNLVNEHALPIARKIIKRVL